MAPETVRLGMVRLTDAAPIVLAHARGMFVEDGLAVSIAVEPSWANVADKLAWGLLDGAVLLPPLAIAMALGLRGPATPLVVPAGISLNGNAITLSRRLADRVLIDGPCPADEAAARLRTVLAGEQPRIAVVHAFSTHDLLLRLFLERGGIDPADVEITVVPPADMAAALASGQIDGFCAGAPWGAVAAQQGVGRTIAVTSGIWRNHPEKCLAVHGGWAASHPDALLALTRAVLRAGVLCDQPSEAPALAELLSDPRWVGVAAPMIAASLPGGEGGDVDRSVFAAHQAGLPNPAHASWFVHQMMRWRAMPANAEEVAKALYRPDLFEQAARDV